MAELSYGLTLVDVINAYNRTKHIIRNTPMEYSYFLSDDIGAECWFKLENLQKTGSFKLRGAANNILSLTEEQLQKGLVCASAGNHAQAVAYMAQLMGVSAYIVVPADTPDTKINGVKRFGCEAIVHGEIYDEAQTYAYQLAKETGRTFVHAYLDPVTIAGQGTATLEALFEDPNFDTVLIPAGGGGLMIGQGIAAKGINPNIRTIGVQTKCSPPWYYTYRDKKMNNDVEFKDTICEGLCGIIEEPNATEAFKCIDEIILVDEETVKEAMRWMADKHHQIIEASSAVVIAAMMENKERFKGHKILSIISGCSVENEFLKEIL
ncbi:MAG: threonine/serine dehydratase [Oscillospiraceae bacterium]